MCPFYLSIGMTYEQYWYGSAEITYYYRKAHDKYIEKKNEEMFMQSRYNYEAFKAVIDEFAYGLGGCKGKKPQPFRKYPYAITEGEKQAEKRRNIQHTLDFVAKGQE